MTWMCNNEPPKSSERVFMSERRCLICFEMVDIEDHYHDLNHTNKNTDTKELNESIIASLISNKEVLQKQLIAKDQRIAELEKKYAEAVKVIQRLSVVEFPMKATSGSDLAQVMLEQNCQIAKDFLKEHL